MNKYALIKDFGAIHDRIKIIANQINKDYNRLEIDIVCLTNAATFFAVDLIRMLEIPTRFHQLGFKSYENSNTPGVIKIMNDIDMPLSGKHVLVLEGMVISGSTPLYIMNYLRLREPASLQICAVGVKPKLLLPSLSVKYCLFEFNNEWIIGYGIGGGLDQTSFALFDKKKPIK
tara:strand:- start:1390 stop:1911 length:522 start_codon:yes stop_codon:yes gene_type:complete